jgi:hypothetical protein
LVELGLWSRDSGTALHLEERCWDAGKLFNVKRDHFRAVLPKFDYFVAYVKSVDPEGKFQNQFTRELFGFAE